MKLKTSKAFRIGNMTHRRGAEITLAEAAGKDLVKRGLAVEVRSAAKARAKDADPLDHDGDGRKGGSLPKAAKAADKGQAE